MNHHKTEFLRLRKDFSPGTIIEDVFEVREFIELGGMGYLFKGYHHRLKRDIAIKVLKKQWLSSSDRKNDFLTEGHQMARIHHQYVARIYDVGVYKDHTYLVMDFVHGQNLYKYVKEKKIKDTETTLEIMTKLAEAVSAVHKAGIIHRDIKPANVMINHDGDPILLDFGIAKADCANGKLGHQSPVKSVTGTPAFIAPECFIDAGKISPASDVYSLGKTFCYMLNGALPKNDDDLQQMTTKDQIVPKKVSTQLNTLIHGMTHKDPAHRLPNGKGVFNELRKIRKSGKSFRGRLIIPIIVSFICVLALWLYKQHRTPAWNPKSRVIAVVPSTNQGGDFSHIPFEFETIIRRYYPYYDLVDRSNIDQTIEEMELIQDGWISKLNSAAIGKMVGAQIFIMFERGSVNGQTLIYPKAYDVETTLLLGNTRIDPNSLQSPRSDKNALQKSVAELILDLNRSLTFRSGIESLKDNSVILKHGQLHGARVGMKVRVLNRKEETVGLLEIVAADKNQATAKILVGNNQIKKKLRVEEVKDTSI